MNYWRWMVVFNCYKGLRFDHGLTDKQARRGAKLALWAGEIDENGKITFTGRNTIEVMYTERLMAAAKQSPSFAEWVAKSEEESEPGDVMLEVEREKKFVRNNIAIEAADDLLSPADWGALILRHAGLAMRHTTQEMADEDRFYRQMVRVAQIALHAAESQLRKTRRSERAGPTEEQLASWRGV